MTASTPKTEYVADTMALVLFLEGRRLPSTVRDIFAAAQKAKAAVHIPGLVCAEVLYLAERGRIQATLAEISDLLHGPGNFQEHPLSLAVVRAAAEISDVRELHDRLIAGTARLLGLPLLSNDLELQRSASVETLW